MKLVLDTNVVIDWLVFDDPYMDPLRKRVLDGAVVVCTHLPAVEELRRVLAYRELKLDEQRQRDVLGRYQAQTACESFAEPLPKGFPRCKDRDDEPFLALAYHTKADALVSRDRAVLALRRRTRAFGFGILNVQEMIAAVAAI